MPPPTASRADCDDHLRVRHRVVGLAQRLGHAVRARTGHQQDVGVPRAGGEEHAEPVDVVDRVQQRHDLPLLAAVRPGVDVAQVHRAAQCPGPARELAGHRGQRGRGLHPADDQPVAGQLPSRARPGRPAEHVGPRGHAPAAQDAAALVDPDSAGCVLADRASRAQSGPASARRRRSPARLSTVAGPRVAAAYSSGRAGQRVVSTPLRSPRRAHIYASPSTRPPRLTESPKLASMNGKSVRMSPANTSCISTRLWNDADLDRHRVIRPSSIRTS